MTEEPTAVPPSAEAAPPIIAEPIAAAPVKPRRSRLQLPLLAMAVVVALIALAATHRFWWPTMQPAVLATIKGDDAPTTTTAPPEPPAATADDDAAAPAKPAESAAPSQTTNGTDLRDLRAAIDDLKQRPLADPEALAALTQTVHQIDDRLRGVEARLDQKETEIRAERALTLASGEITEALANSTPYDAPIAIIKSVAGNDPALADPLATLEASAKTGLPSRWTLSQKLTELATQMADPAPDDASSGFWDRTLARMSNLVTIHRERDADHPDAPLTPDALIATAQKALIAGDLDAAIQQVQQIQGKDAELVSGWLALATSRRDAERAASALQAALTQRLAATGPAR